MERRLGDDQAMMENQALMENKVARKWPKKNLLLVALAAFAATLPA